MLIRIKSEFHVKCGGLEQGFAKYLVAYRHKVNTNLSESLKVHGTIREGFKTKQKKVNYPHFVDKRITPPPLSTSAEVNNIHSKEFV